VSFKRFHQIGKIWQQTLQSQILSGLKAVVVASLATTGLVVATKQLGVLQPLELRAYDYLVRMSPDQGYDDRLLIVTITEQDIKTLNRATPADQDIAKVLANLQRHQPSVIGLDLYRDVPNEPGQAELKAQLAVDNVIVITKIGDKEEYNIPPPPDMPSERVGFNDLLIDPDGVIRRNLLFARKYYSFSLRLALKYLEPLGISPRASDRNEDDMQLGSATFVPLRRNTGGYQWIDDGGYQVLLNYRSARQIARRVTFTEAFRDQLQPEWVKNKIVLIGTTAASGKDLFYTPYSASERTDHQMAGVEVHAQSVSQILSAAFNEEPLIWAWPESLEWLWIAIWAGVGGGLAWCVRHPLWLGLRGTVALLLLTSSCFAILTIQGWVPLVAPALALSLTLGVVVAYRAQQAQRQHQMVMMLLGQNTSPEIANALWESRDRLIQSGKLPGQRLTATMLFTDIRDFSSIAEQMSPENLLEWLNEYLETMTHAIQEHNGIINKFTGDGLMAVFGVPVARSDEAEVAQDAYNAVACALVMGDRLSQLNHSWQQRGLSAVQMRVGIFTGPVVAGSLGGKDRMEYGVIGDSVNIAARLESCAKDRQTGVCRVLIAQETLNYVQDRVQVEDWGPMALKGKQQLVNVYRVIKYLPSPSVEIIGYNLKSKAEYSNSEAETKANSVNL
jgi:adenylate cyclase